MSQPRIKKRRPINPVPFPPPAPTPIAQPKAVDQAAAATEEAGFPQPGGRSQQFSPKDVDVMAKLVGKQEQQLAAINRQNMLLTIELEDAQKAAMGRLEPEEIAIVIKALDALPEHEPTIALIKTKLRR